MSPIDNENKETQTIDAGEVGSVDSILKSDASHAAVGNVLSQNIQAAADAESNIVVEAEPTEKERLIFALKSLIELVENDSVRVDQLREKDANGEFVLSIPKILDMAEAEAVKAGQGAQDLKNATE